MNLWKYCWKNVQNWIGIKADMKKIEAIYKCRCCDGFFSIETEGIVRFDVQLIIKTEKCSNCCVKTTNNATIVVVADLIKYIFVDK